MSWLINSMNNSIAEIYLLYSSAQAIWDAITLASQMFHLRTRSQNLRQGAQYFNNLTKLWQELDLFAPQSWHDPKDAAIYRKILARERTYDFLAGLDRTLDDTRGRILGIKPLPSLDEIFAEVRREGSRKHIILSLSSSMDSSALAVRQFDGRNK